MCVGDKIAQRGLRRRQPLGEAGKGGGGCEGGGVRVLKEGRAGREKTGGPRDG